MIGKRRTLVEFQGTRQGTADAYGHVQPSEQRLFERWVSLADRGSREFFRADQVESDITWQLIADYDPQVAALTTEDRAVIAQSGRVLNIASVINEEERNRTVRILCREAT